MVRVALMAVFPMVDTSEPRYGEIARLMAETGDWITPWFEPGVPFWGKPPFAFWMSALSFRLLGYSEFAARLPAGIATLLTAYVLFQLALSLYGARVARWAVLIYTTSLLPFVAAGAVLTDPYLTLAVTLSLVAVARLREQWHSPWRYGLSVGLALGMLAKGPLTLVLVVAAALPWMLWQGLTLSYLRKVRWMGPIGVFLLLTLPWYVLAEIKTPGFLNYFIIGEHVSRFVNPGWQGDLYGTAHRRMPGSIWLDWLLATFPWGLVALWKLVSWGRTQRGWLGVVRGWEPVTTLLVCWALATPLFFTLSGNILWTYVQPSLPAFAILLALALVQQPSLPATQARLRSLLAVVPVAAIALAAVALAVPDTLRTEQGLVQFHAAQAGAGQPLYYVDSRPFSARYYSRDQAGLATSRQITEVLGQQPSGLYLAVESEHLAALDGLIVSPVLYKNRRYVLVFARPGEAAAATTPLVDAQP